MEPSFGNHLQKIVIGRYEGLCCCLRSDTICRLESHPGLHYYAPTCIHRPVSDKARITLKADVLLSLLVLQFTITFPLFCSTGRRTVTAVMSKTDHKWYEIEIVDHVRSTVIVKPTSIFFRLKITTGFLTRINISSRIVANVVPAAVTLVFTSIHIKGNVFIEPEPQRDMVLDGLLTSGAGQHTKSAVRLSA